MIHEWWIGKDSEGSGRRTLWILSWHFHVLSALSCPDIPLGTISMQSEGCSSGELQTRICIGISIFSRYAHIYPFAAEILGSNSFSVSPGPRLLSVPKLFAWLTPRIQQHEFDIVSLLVVTMAVVQPSTSSVLVDPCLNSSEIPRPFSVLLLKPHKF
jgi:hypothetical protein